MGGAGERTWHRKVGVAAVEERAEVVDWGRCPDLVHLGLRPREQRLYVDGAAALGAATASSTRVAACPALALGGDVEASRSGSS